MVEILIASVANFITRIFPFVLFKRIPKRLKIFKLYFPATILIVLILYIITQNNTHTYIYIHQFIGIIVTIVLHLRFNHYLISIFGGSFVYIYFVNFI
jgi:branched-subunit amino acid transport protein AzlD